jgi:hypothetical protein
MYTLVITYNSAQPSFQCWYPTRRHRSGLFPERRPCVVLRSGDTVTREASSPSAATLSSSSIPPRRRWRRLPEAGADSKDAGFGAFLVRLVSPCSDLSGFCAGRFKVQPCRLLGRAPSPRRRLPRAVGGLCTTDQQPRRPVGSRAPSSMRGRGLWTGRSRPHGRRWWRRSGPLAVWARARGGSFTLRVGGWQEDGEHTLPCGMLRLSGLLPAQRRGRAVDTRGWGALGRHHAVPVAFGGVVAVTQVGLSGWEDRELRAGGGGYLLWFCGCSRWWIDGICWWWRGCAVFGGGRATWWI